MTAIVYNFFILHDITVYYKVYFLFHNMLNQQNISRAFSMAQIHWALGTCSYIVGETDINNIIRLRASFSSGNVIFFFVSFILPYIHPIFQLLSYSFNIYCLFSSVYPWTSFLTSLCLNFISVKCILIGDEIVSKVAKIGTWG